VAIVAYRYYSDDGNVYQILLPSEFAAPLNYVEADGSEIYLPSYISPRYATYQDAMPALWLSAVITDPYQPGNPPASVEIGSNIYSLKSSYGEVRGNTGDPRLITVAGPQGQKGDTGAQGNPGTDADIINASGVISSAELLAINSIAKTLVAAPGSNKFIGIIKLSAKYVYGGTAYGGVNNLTVGWSTFQVALITGAVMTGSVDGYADGGAGISTTTVNVTNQPLIVTAAANYTTGNGTVKWNLDYRIVDYN